VALPEGEKHNHELLLVARGSEHEAIRSLRRRTSTKRHVRLEESAELGAIWSVLVAGRQQSAGHAVAI
jgi:hypothetical protein